MCVINCSVLLCLLIFRLSVPALQSTTGLLSGVVTTVPRTTDPSTYTTTRPISALPPDLTPRKCWPAAATDAVITVLRRSYRFCHVPSNRRIREFRQRRGARVTP